MADRTFYQQDNIGRARYTLSFHDGVSTHRDGSPFFGIAIFHNKKKLNAYRNNLLKQGYYEK